jgi:hypothetical protein
LRSPRTSARAAGRGSARASDAAAIILPALPDPLRLLEILVDCM